MKEEGLKDESELQSYMIVRIEKYLNDKGREIIGWDEILDGGLAPNATVMSWRGTEGGIAAARMGHYAIMTPESHCYLDHYQDDPETQPLAFGACIPIGQTYSYDPAPDSLGSDICKYILGVQGNVWPNICHLRTCRIYDIPTHHRSGRSRLDSHGEQASGEFQETYQQRNTIHPDERVQPVHLVGTSADQPDR